MREESFAAEPPSRRYPTRRADPGERGSVVGLEFRGRAAARADAVLRRHGLLTAGAAHERAGDREQGRR